MWWNETCFSTFLTMLCVLTSAAASSLYNGVGVAVLYLVTMVPIKMVCSLEWVQDFSEGECGKGCPWGRVGVEVGVEGFIVSHVQQRSQNTQSFQAVPIQHTHILFCIVFQPVTINPSIFPSMPCALGLYMYTPFIGVLHGDSRFKTDRWALPYWLCMILLDWLRDQNLSSSLPYDVMGSVSHHACLVHMTHVSWIWQQDPVLDSLI